MELVLSPTSVFLYALITAIATGLGAIPLFFHRKSSPLTTGAAGAVAAGLMAGASWGLVAEGFSISITRTLVGVVLGVIVIRYSHKWLEGKDVKWGSLEAADARKVLMIIGIMTAHSFSEGVGVGVSFGGGEALGVFITAAIAIHNIPEGLAIAFTMVPRGTPVWKASLWGIFSSLPQPLMAVPAFLFVSFFAPFLPVGLGFAAGTMGWMILSEMIPEAREAMPGWGVVTAVAASAAVMVGLQTLL